LQFVPYGNQERPVEVRGEVFSPRQVRRQHATFVELGMTLGFQSRTRIEFTAHDHGNSSVVVPDRLRPGVEDPNPGSAKGQAAGIIDMHVADDTRPVGQRVGHPSGQFPDATLLPCHDPKHAAHGA
jgi:hypothetical protein